MARQGGMTGGQAAKAAVSLQKMKGAVFTLTGDKKLIRTLNKTRDSIARKGMRKALGKAIRVIVKGMKAAVPADQKGIKQVLGGRVGKAKGGSERGMFTAKAGAGVGKAYSKKATRSQTKAKAPTRGEGGRFQSSGRTTQKGVGIGGRNVHWWIMGTAERKSSRGSTGAMPPQAPEVVKQGFASSAGEAAAVIKQTIAAELAKPAKR